MQVKHLRKRNHFVAMRHKSEVVFTSAFTLQYAKCETILKNDDLHVDDSVHIGFTVTKKVGNAVQRNKVKRRLREVFRLHFVPECEGGYCYVMIGNAKMLRMSFEELVKNTKFALRKMNQAQLNKENLRQENLIKQMV